MKKTITLFQFSTSNIAVLFSVEFRDCPTFGFPFHQLFGSHHLGPGNGHRWAAADADGEHRPQGEGPLDPNGGSHRAGKKDPGGSKWTSGLEGFPMGEYAEDSPLNKDYINDYIYTVYDYIHIYYIYYMII